MHLSTPILLKRSSQYVYSRAFYCNNFQKVSIFYKSLNQSLNKHPILSLQQQQQQFSIATTSFNNNQGSNNILSETPIISTKEYLSLISNTVESINDKMHLKFEELKINDPDYDVSLSSDGVLQIQLGESGTYVISRQTPTKQLV